MDYDSIAIAVIATFELSKHPITLDVILIITKLMLKQKNLLPGSHQITIGI